jgi:YesN/AraC family two-component response regulator
VGENGEDGLKLFKDHAPNLIITDLNMPKMNGITFINRVRTMDANIPIIVTSALTDVDALIQSIELRVNKYILKPFSPDEILGAIDIMSRHIVLAQISTDFLMLDQMTEDQMNTLQLVLRNNFTSIIKEIYGKGAPKVKVKVNNNFLELYLYDTFSAYEEALSTSIYDASFINTLRKSLYTHLKNKIEKKLTFATGLTIKLIDLQISINDSTEKFVFSISK